MQLRSYVNPNLGFFSSGSSMQALRLNGLHADLHHIVLLHDDHLLIQITSFLDHLLQ